MAIGRIPKAKPPARRRAAKPLSTAKLTQLGEKVGIPKSPSEAILEIIPISFNKPFTIRFTCPEFTSRCPKTGAPDFAVIMIDYIPNLFLVESKSLKLFLGSFRDHGAFHEDCVVQIASKIMRCASPQWLRIGAYFQPRGGIPIDVFWQSGEPPKDVWIPDQGVPPYRGR